MADTDVNDVVPTTPPRSSVTWDPFAELDSWLRRLGYTGDGGRGTSLTSSFDGVDFTPLADVVEGDDAWTIDIELPGVKKKNIEVETQGRRIVIRGERKDKERDGVLRHRRRVTGSFRYEVVLGGDFDAEHITAALDNGELVITVPKQAADHPRKIDVT